MSAIFLKIANMSISASYLVLVVLALRVLLKKAPKWVCVLLWGLVAVRLVCPFSVESALSLIPSSQTIPDTVLTGPSFDVQTGINPVDTQVNEYLVDHYFEGVTVPVDNGVNTVTILSAVWLIGMGALLIYTTVSCLILRRKVATAIILKDNIFQSENVGSPFVFGIFRPRIYLPFGLDEESATHVIAHERAHIRRKDHWWKPLGFLLLTIHWFNPLMWLGYTLLCRDIELACDEKVIKELGSEQRADYTQALLDCSVGRRMIAACPLAFGEVGVKERVRSVMHYKKPAFWLILLALVVCGVVAVCFLTNPVETVTNPWVQEYLPDAETGVDKEEYESISPDFAIGADQYGRPVFKDPHRAFDTFTELYAEGIALIRQAYSLPPISGKNYDVYKIYGWQVTTGSEEVRDQAAFVSRFLDIYENSFAETWAMMDLADIKEGYTLQQAEADGCVVLVDSTLMAGGRRWIDFVQETHAGLDAMIRIYQAYSDPEIYFVKELSYDGRKYHLRYYDRTGDTNEEFLSEQTYKYLVYSQFTTKGAVTDNYLLADSPHVTAEGYINALTSSVARPENDIYNHCESIYCVVLERLDSDRMRGVAYVSNQCIYRDIHSSDVVDTGSRYLLSDHSMTFFDRYTGTYKICSIEEWEKFPYTDQEWKAMFRRQGPNTIPGPRGDFENVGYKPVDEQRFLMKMDDLLWLVERKDGYVSYIYSLVPENENGSAVWDFCPAISSRTPVFGFHMDAENISIHASCDSGRLVSFDEPSVAGYPSGETLKIPAGCGLYWSPMDENGIIAAEGEVLVHLFREEEYLGCFTILLSGEKGEGHCQMHYTATLVGEGVYLRQAEEADGGVITLTADERPGATRFIVNIVDRAKTENIPCDTALQPFYEDDDYFYYFDCIKSQFVIVTYNNGNSEDIVTALENGHATIADLDAFGIDYITQSK